MTKPIYEPSPTRTDAVLGYGSDQLQRRPSPVNAGDIPVIPYPPVYPQVAITSNLTSHRFWPGGWIVVPAYAYAVDGTVGGTFTGAYAHKRIRHDQSAANFAAAATTLSFTPEDIGLPTGTDAPWYGVHVGMRVNDTGTNIGVRLSPKGEDPFTDDTGYGQYIMNTGIVKNYFGLFRLYYTKSPGFPITGYIHKFMPGETIEIKLYRTAGSGSVDLDNIYFYPALAAGADPAVDEAEQVSHVLSMSSVSTLSATAGYSGFGGNPSEPYCDAGGGGGGIQDTQIRRGWRDPNLEWSGACGMSAGFAEEGMPANNVDDHLAFHPRHVYAAARLRGTDDADFGKTDSGGFIALGMDSRVVGQAHVYSDHWGFNYLGCHPHMVNAQGEYNLGLWMPNQDDDFPVGFPFCSTGDNALYEAMVGHDVWFSSSRYDWRDYRNGIYVWAEDALP